MAGKKAAGVLPCRGLVDSLDNPQSAIRVAIPPNDAIGVPFGKHYGVLGSANRRRQERRLPCLSRVNVFPPQCVAHASLPKCCVIAEGLRGREAVTIWYLGTTEHKRKPWVPGCLPCIHGL